MKTCVQQETRRQKKTLKKTRKFMVDGVEVSVTTSKIVSDSDTKNEEMRFLRWVFLALLGLNMEADPYTTTDRNSLLSDPSTP